MKHRTPPIYFHLPDYKFYDSPYPWFSSGSDAEIADNKYMERKIIQDQLRARILDSSASRSGAIFVTGFRGVGKTSLVRKVLRDLRAEDDKVIYAAEINLAQDDIDERAIFRLLTIELHKQFQNIRTRPFHVGNLLLRLARWVLVAAVFLKLSHFFDLPDWLLPGGAVSEVLRADWLGMGKGWLQEMLHLQDNGWVVILDAILIPALVALLTYLLLGKLMERFLHRYMVLSVTHLKRRLEDLLAHMHAEITREQSVGLSALKELNPLSMGMRKSVSYPLATTKEIELELIDILKMFTSLQSKRFMRDSRIVFVVDELDKLVPQSSFMLPERESEKESDGSPLVLSKQGIRGHENEVVRNRQETIAALFANLKHFLNVAEAKFIFIGGRELYDAVLADTSNRDAFFSSIFNQVIYVPSFLKEKQKDVTGAVEGLATTTERFVARALLPLSEREKIAANRTERLGDVMGMVGKDWQGTKLNSGERLFLYTAIQNFSVYLTFRSNGVAKKLIQLFERSVVQLDDREIAEMRRSGQALVVGMHRTAGRSLYLRLDANDQYAHHLMTYLYRPFISQGSHYYSALNDKQLVTLTYILDHIFKFHPTAFSFSHLELAPDTIAVNKVPELRKYISDVLGRLSQQHLRAIDNGLFGFQFYNKIYSEIAYLSKISELDAAAMNFTLDESLPVKQHFYKRLYRLIKLEKDHERLKGVKSMSQIADVHNWLGDLHFYDAEHEEAMSQYRAASRYYVPPIDPAGTTGRHLAQRMAPEQFDEYVRATLKQIHCLDKMKALEEGGVLAASLGRSIIEYLTAPPDEKGDP